MGHLLHPGRERPGYGANPLVYTAKFHSPIIHDHSPIVHIHSPMVLIHNPIVNDWESMTPHKKSVGRLRP